MVAKRWFEGSSYPSNAPLIVLHPNFSDQHRLLPTFLNQPDRAVLCLTLHGHATSLRAFWEHFQLMLRDQAHISLPALEPDTTPEEAAMIALRALHPAGPFALILDAYDLADQDEMSVWITAFSSDLPHGSQVILGGRRLPTKVLEMHPQRSKIVLYPLDYDRMLLNYLDRAEGRTLLEVYGHGPGRVLVNGREIDEWDGTLPRSLFFYFIDRGMVTREEIFRTFWPTLATREATNVFHVTKRKISEILGFDLTVYWAGFYRIRSEVDLHYDVIKFVENVQNSAVAGEGKAMELLHQALHLYHGTFVTTISGSWADARREDLQGTYVDALTALARLHEKVGQEQEALGLYMRALSFQPYREDLACSVMTIYDRIDQPERCEAAFERVVDELRRRFGVEPDRRTVELMEQIRKRRKR